MSNTPSGLMQNIPSPTSTCKDIPDMLIWFIMTHPQYLKATWGVGHELAKLYPPQVVYDKLNEIDPDGEYIDYGTSLMTSWLTPKGRAKAEEVFAANSTVGPIQKLYKYLKFIGEGEVKS
jgi:hypothetical protein